MMHGNTYRILPISLYVLPLITPGHGLSYSNALTLRGKEKERKTWKEIRKKKTNVER
jgi:hypothetical protein